MRNVQRKRKESVDIRSYYQKRLIVLLVSKMIDNYEGSLYIFNS